MASPPIPPSLGHLAARPFSFYPPILNIEHNEWIFRRATWSDILAVNRKTGLEISIPRRFVGDVSIIDDPVVIVGLVRELEFQDGLVSPCRRRVIEMPLAVGDSSPAPVAVPRRNAPAPVVGIRVESRRDRRAFRLLVGALAVAILLYTLLLLNLTRVDPVRHRAARPVPVLHHPGRQ
jgi:hypothetical protein